MVTVLGLDIGGANTKAACLKTRNGEVVKLKTTTVYFPFWKRNRDQFCKMLSKLKKDFCATEVFDKISITMTAELSDVFSTKREGVNYILDCVYQSWTKTPIVVLNVEANLWSVEAAKSEPLKVAAANWAATGWMVSQKIKDCIVIDVGSTSTSIIPIINGKVAAAGKTDFEKLISGELVYTGSLRTNVAAIVQTVPIRGGFSRVSSELFAQSGDVHLVLKNIKAEEYVADTPDGKGKSRNEALTRLAKVVCADMEILNEQEIVLLAEYVFERQIDQIACALDQVYSRLHQNSKELVPTVVTGFGKTFLAYNAARKAGIKKIIGLDQIFPKNAVLASPAVGVALMAATQLEGEELRW